MFLFVYKILHQNIIITFFLKPGVAYCKCGPPSCLLFFTTGDDRTRVRPLAAGRPKRGPRAGMEVERLWTFPRKLLESQVGHEPQRKSLYVRDSVCHSLVIY